MAQANGTDCKRSTLPSGAPLNSPVASMGQSLRWPVPEVYRLILWEVSGAIEDRTKRFDLTLHVLAKKRHPFGPFQIAVIEQP